MLLKERLSDFLNRFPCSLKVETIAAQLRRLLHA